nr:gustatory receptor 26 [Papilio xuthus]
MGTSSLFGRVTKLQIIGNKLTNLVKMPYRPDQYKIENIIKSVKALLIFENVFCIFRYIPKKVKNVKRLQIFGVIVCTISILYFLLNVKIPDMGIDFNITAALSPILFLLQYYITLILLYFTWNNSLLQILKRFAEIDKTLCILVAKDFYLKSRAGTMKLTFFFILFHILQITLYVYYESNLQTVEFILLFAYIERNLEITLLCRFIYMLKKRLVILNYKLSSYLKRDNQSFKKSTLINVSQLNKRIEDRKIEIRKLAIAYIKVGEIMHMLNNDFNFQLFMMLTSCFVVIVFSTWACFYCVWSGKCSISFYNIVIWTVTEITVMGIVSFICEDVLSVRKNTIEYLDQIVIDFSLCANTRTQAKVFRALINAWPLRIIVYEIYPIGFKLIIDFIGLTTTSIIIVLQISHIF